MAETKKTTATKTVKSSEKATATKAAAPKKTTTTKATTAKKTTAKAAEVKAVEAVKVEEVKVEAPKAEKKAAPAPKKANGPMIKVTLVKSGSGRLEKQIRTLKALGLNKTNSSNIVPDNAATRGMIFVVKHLVSVEEVK
jgi:large subunit ribosomal protein L30